MSCNLYVMLATRQSLVDKFTIRSIWIKDEQNNLVEQKFLPVWAGSEIRQYMSEIADEYNVGYTDNYFTNPPDLKRECFSEYEIRASFVPVSVFIQELQTLIDTPVERSEENSEYYSELVENRKTKINFLCELLGCVHCYDQDFATKEQYLLYWTE